MPRMTVSCLALLMLLPASTRAMEPIVEEVNGEQLKDQCRRLMEALDDLGSPLRPEVARELAAILNEPVSAKGIVRIQELLDPQCLIAVHINPESRVKAARGPAAAKLGKGPTYLLIKVHNEAGVTHALTVRGPQLRSEKQTGPERWLEATVVSDAPLATTLRGQTVEYVVLRLTPHETGKREATLRFDVGQGTQDLGFRAEVPVLFTIR